MSIPLLKEGIREIVEDLGTVLDIRAGKSLKQRGQAFVVYSSVEEATEAHDILQDIELFGRKIQVQYARARSDATVQKDDGEEALAEHKKVRLAEKGEYTMNHTYNTGPSADHSRQHASKLSKRPNPSNVPPSATPSPSDPPRPTKPPQPWPTTISLLTGSFYSATSLKAMARPSSPLYFSDTPASRRSAWSLAVLVWRLRSTRRRPSLRRPERPSMECLWEIPSSRSLSRRSSDETIM